MKKYFMIIIAMIITSSHVHAITDTEIAGQLRIASTVLKGTLEEPNIAISVQDDAIRKWENIFNNAKSFAADNSKTVGVKDSDLMNALTEIDNFQSITISIIRSSRNASKADLAKQRMQLDSPHRNINNVISGINAKKFTLPHKIKAQKVIVEMGTSVRTIIMGAIKNIDFRSNSSTSLGLPPSRPLPDIPTKKTSTPMPEIPKATPSVPSPFVAFLSPSRSN